MLTVDSGKTLATALAAGVRLFQYRNKSGSRKEVYNVSFELAGMVKRSGGVFIVNDHADIAKAVDADPRALYRLLRALASVGVFEEAADGRFQNTELSSTLERDLARA
mgnify:CR=1 FL=1